VVEQSSSSASLRLGSDPAEVGDGEDGEVVLGAKGREVRSCDGSSAE
jgi:hypothetical protein